VTAPTAASYHQAVQLVANVTAPHGDNSLLPGLPVNFFDGSTYLGTGTLNAAGFASITTSVLTVGDHASITASFDATDRFLASSGSPTAILHISQTSVAVAVDTSAEPSAFTAPVTFTATVTPAFGNATELAGQSVSFSIDGHTVGTGTLNSLGQATFTTPAGGSLLTVGSHTIVATYGGSPNFLSNFSPNLTQDVRWGTRVTMSSSRNPSAQGQSVSFTAHVIPSFVKATALAGLTVTFFEGGVALGTANLGSTGVGTFTTNALGVGTHDITAVFAGSNAFVGSTSAVLTQTVLNASSVALTSSAVISQQGVPVAFTAAVSSPAGTPTGMVRFYVNGVLRAAGRIMNGKVRVVLSGFTIGNYTVQAVYAGDASFVGSSRALLQRVVNRRT
jgi:hypothetical protein